MPIDAKINVLYYEAVININEKQNELALKKLLKLVDIYTYFKVSQPKQSKKQED